MFDDFSRCGENNEKRTFPGHHLFIEGSLEAKLPTIWTDGKAQPGRSSDMEKVRGEKIREAEDQKGRPSEEIRCSCAKT